MIRLRSAGRLTSSQRIITTLPRSGESTRAWKVLSTPMGGVGVSNRTELEIESVGPLGLEIPLVHAPAGDAGWYRASGPRRDHILPRSDQVGCIPYQLRFDPGFHPPAESSDYGLAGFVKKKSFQAFPRLWIFPGACPIWFYRRRSYHLDKSAGQCLTWVWGESFLKTISTFGRAPRSGK